MCLVLEKITQSVDSFTDLRLIDNYNRLQYTYYRLNRKYQEGNDVIFYVSLAVSNFKQSATFYDAFLAEFNAKRFVDRDDKYIAWGKSMQDTLLSISPKRSESTNPDTQETVIAFEVETSEEVDRLFARGLELGATVAIPLKLNDRDSYSGCLRDFDGYTLRLYCMTA